jgi:hypothetical protein
MVSCQECSKLHLSLGTVSKEIPLSYGNNNSSQWIYFTAAGDAGNNEISIEPDGIATIRKIMIYSDSHEGETLPNILSEGQSKPSVLDYTQVSPTEYQATINASHSFILLLDLPYQTSWSANVNGHDYDAIAVYPGINGFYIPESGIVRVVIEYGLQRWFMIGAVLTILTFIGCISYLIWDRKPMVYHLLIKSRIIKHDSKIDKS